MATRKATSKKSARRVAIVDGLRTPFVKGSTLFKTLSTLDLAQACVSELVARTNLDTSEIDQLVYGAVVPSIDGPNIAREIVLGTGLPRDIDAYSVVRACATSTQALVSGAQAILTGDAEVAIVGGADSVSKPPVTLSDGFIEVLMEANNARTAMGKAKAFLELKPKDLVPKPPALKELSTGLTMGQSAEVMAKENQIPRLDQDQLAAQSHKRAAEAWEKGLYADEVMPFTVPPDYQQTIERDAFIRPDTTVEALTKLRPAFDREHGSITAGNSSGLTDGASAVLIMEEKKAKALGYTPLAFLESWGFAGLDASWQLLMGPAFATPIALDKAGLTLADLTLIDMHEAFAAQVLSNLKAWGSAEFCAKHLGRKEALGDVHFEDDRFNVHGGSIALGHPFGATGTRQVLTMARELNRRGGGSALITQCAAGGLGAAVVLTA